MIFHNIPYANRGYGCAGQARSFRSYPEPLFRIKLVPTNPRANRRSGCRHGSIGRFVMQENVARADRSRAIPFDAAKLDRLMEAAGLDVVVATSKHNVQYLLGAERAIFFDYMDALGVSRYLPVLIYPKGAPEHAVYVGHRLETHQRAVAPPWIAQVRTESNGSVDAITRAVSLIRDAGVPLKRVGVDGVPADGCGPGAWRCPARRGAQGRTAGAGAAARGEVGRRAGETQDGLRARHRLDAGGDRRERAEHDQAAIVGRLADRRSQSRADLRILPARLRQQPQPGAVCATLGAR